MRAELVSLYDLKKFPRNPKSHDLGAVRVSIDTFGFIDRIVINEITGNLLAGHGRVEVLEQMAAHGEDRPDGVETIQVISEFDDKADWLIPVDFVRVPADHEAAAVIALNRTSELGGWDDHALAALLQEIADENISLLAATGFDEDDLAEMLREIDPLSTCRMVSGGRDEFGDPPQGFEITVSVESVDDKNKIIVMLSEAGFESKVTIQR